MNNTPKATSKPALLLYLCRHYSFNRTALNKIIFFVDLLHYLKHQALATSCTYRKMAYGPVPLEMYEVRNLLLSNNLLIETTSEYFGLRQFFYSTSQNVDFKIVKQKLTENTKTIADLVLEKLGRHTAGELSELSHQIEPWKSSEWDQILSFDKSLFENNDTQDTIRKIFPGFLGEQD